MPNQKQNFCNFAAREFTPPSQVTKLQAKHQVLDQNMKIMEPPNIKIQSWLLTSRHKTLKAIVQGKQEKCSKEKGICRLDSDEFGQDLNLNGKSKVKLHHLKSFGKLR